MREGSEKAVIVTDTEPAKPHMEGRLAGRSTEPRKSTGVSCKRSPPYLMRNLWLDWYRRGKEWLQPKQELASRCSSPEHTYTYRIEEATFYLASVPVVEWLAT